ncbi:MAG: hypothetical protein AAF961_13790, partial [Planctomycetota bacterium]
TTRCTVICRQLPRDWSEAVAPRYDGVELQGVLLGTQDDEGQPHFLLVTERLQWRPSSHPSQGIRWLAARGMDVALLDEVRHGQRFARPGDGGEASAFYACLSLMRQENVRELAETVETSLRTSQGKLTAAADSARSNGRRSAARRRDVGDAPRAAVAAKEAKQQALLAASVAEQAEQGRSSVAPLFLRPDENTGELVLIEGIARRAVRVAANPTERTLRAGGNSSHAGSHSADGALDELREYFEIEVFTPDSQNLPIICCAAQLPPGFPQGDVIREPVRTAGVFFKQWAYETRTDDATGDARRRSVAPIVVAPSVIWLNDVRDDDAGLPRYAVWGGVAFLCGLAALWAIYYADDRRARRRTTRIDGEFADLR